MKKILFTVLCFFCFVNLFGQENDFGIGQWRSHFPYNNLKSVAVDNKGLVYAASSYCLFSYEVETGLVDIISKVNRLSDIGVSCIKYNYTYDLLFIAYNNSNIDILKDGKTINISDIYRSSIVGNKTINNIYFLDKYAYLSCGFGVVVVDIDKYEVADTYFIGENGQYVNVSDFTYWEKENTFVASTENGLYKAKKDDEVNLAYYGNWSFYTDYPTTNKSVNHIETFRNCLFINVNSETFGADTLLYNDGSGWQSFYSTTNTIYNMDESNNHLIINYYSSSGVYNTNFERILESWKYSNGAGPYPRQTVMDKDGTYWAADISSGLVYFKNGWEGTSILPSGPKLSYFFNISTYKDDIYIFSGGYNASWAPFYRQPSYAVFKNNEWSTVNRLNMPALENVYDICDIAIDPRNENHFFLASYNQGLIEVLDKEIVNIYNATNSPLETHGSVSPTHVRSGGVKFDDNNNLWVTSSLGSKPLAVLMADGTWGSLSFGNGFSGLEVSSIVIDKSGQKWLRSRNAGQIFVVNDNGTPGYPGDDQTKVLSTAIGNGAIPGQTIYAIACDNSGKVWIGTDMGVAVFHYPENIFSGGNYDASQILVETDEDVRPLLESETVTSICVDYGNKKWFGTSSSGVYYVSEDGKTELAHFTKDNSPILSNSINHIAINDLGEVFFITDYGICSFKGDSVTPTEDYDSIYAYPNPVRPGYDGPIAVAGLKENSYVKITDSAGRIVFSDISNGGQVVWDGNIPSGKKASSGVYIVFVVDSDGTEKASTKILVVR